MSIVIQRVQRLVREKLAHTWTDDRVLQTLPNAWGGVILFDDLADLPDIDRFVNQHHGGAHIHVYHVTKNPPVGQSIRICNVATDLQEVHTLLRHEPAPHFLIDLLHDDVLKERTLRQCLYYLKPNGVYISAHLDTEQSVTADFIRGVFNRRIRPGFNEHAQAAIHKVGAIAEREPAGEVATDRLAAAITSARINKHYAVLRKQFTHLLKLRDSELDEHLIHTKKLDWAQDHQRQPAGRLVSKASVHVNLERFKKRFPQEFNLPILRVREYDDVTCLRREAVYRDSVFLPDTFRLTGQDYLRNVAIQDVDINFAMPGNHPKPGKLAGHYYHLDTEYPNVYGHLMTDMIGRLWAWQELKAAHPDLKVLISDRANKHDLPAWVRAMLNAYGIADEDIQLLHKPMRVEKLYAPTPQFVNYQNGYPHPGLLRVWQDLRDNLLADSTATDLPVKLFISRVPDQNRLCRNRDELEQYFTNNGFAVLRPETMPLPDQVQLFANATHIAGYGGSAMLNGIFSNGEPKKRLIINPWTHHPINEYLISSLHGDDITYLYQEPEITKATETKVQGAFHSPYTFDFNSGRDLLDRFMQD